MQERDELRPLKREIKMSRERKLKKYVYGKERKKRKKKKRKRKRRKRKKVVWKIDMKRMNQVKDE
jgi:hypothetical protein